MTTNRMGREGADVLSTPSLLGLMEQASIRVTEPNLPRDTPPWATRWTACVTWRRRLWVGA